MNPCRASEDSEETFRSHDDFIHGLNPHQLFVLKVTSLAAGSVSIASVLIASYWFLRMRRSFRHDLIMLLMQSDMFKAIWFMVYPIVEFKTGVIKTRSAFCQISGFFLTVGIEACDVAVVIIAVHTALSIFGRCTHNGLYRFHHIAYGIYIGLPLLLASLAFIKKPAFVNSGEFCYLPTNQSWSRQALSWIPRYVVFVTIMTIYACVYVHVSSALTKYGKLTSGARRDIPSSDGHADQKRRRDSLPKMPKLSYHGLIPTTPSSSRRSSSNKKESLLTGNVPDLGGSRRNSGAPPSVVRVSVSEKPAQTIKWRMPDFGMDSANSTDPEKGVQSSGVKSASYLTDSNKKEGQDGAAGYFATPIPSRNQDGEESPTFQPTSTRNSLWNRAILAGESRRASAASLIRSLSILRHSTMSPTPESANLVLTPTVLSAIGMTETRESMRRQALQLFIYPLVYIGVWIMPLVAHIARSRGHEPPFIIDLLSMLSLCIQGAVDAFVFSIREKPWRAPKGLENCQPLPWWKARGPNVSTQHAGRTREEMTLDSRLATIRLNGELAEKRSEQHLRKLNTIQWWEVYPRGFEDTRFDA